MQGEYMSCVTLGDMEVMVAGPDPTVCADQSKRVARDLIVELGEYQAMGVL